MAYQNYPSRSGNKPKWVKPPVIKEPRKVCQWSNYQTAIFDDIANGVGHTQVDSYAGTGKSTTLVEGLYHIPKFRQPALMVAFASANQKDLERKAPEGITVLTFHSLGFRAAKKKFPKINRPDDKGEKLWGFIKAERGEDPDTYELRENIAKCVSLAKGYLADTADEIDPIMDRHEIDPCGESRDGFIGSVIKIMNGCKNDTNRMDFDDMTWFPYIHNLNLEKYGHVLIDEDQDLNKAQIHIGLASCAANGRITGVGDERQAIYGFRGADSNAVQNIVDKLNAKRLTLSVTYRCARAIVELAQQFVPGLEAAPNAEDGRVEYGPDNLIEQMAQPGDFILSRTNAPLIKWCLALLKARVPANIQGKDLGKNMISLIKRSKAKDVTAFLGWLAEYEGLEVERLVNAKRDPAVLQDKTECLRVLCEGTKDLSEVRQNIDRLFYEGDDKNNRVILSTTHKAKGIERDRVFVLMDTYKPGKNIEEDNLTYVAFTRAKKELWILRQGA
jgi:superfamily I DNA/RNA helicase